MPLPPGAEEELRDDNPRLPSCARPTRRSTCPVARRVALDRDARRRLPRPALVPRRDADHLALPRAAADHASSSTSCSLRYVARARRARPARPARGGRRVRLLDVRVPGHGPGAAATCSSRSTSWRSSSAQLGLVERDGLSRARHRRGLRPPGAPHDARRSRTSPTTAASTRSPSRRSSASTTCATAAATPPARVVAAARARRELEPGRFDLAVNIHCVPGVHATPRSSGGSSCSRGSRSRACSSSRTSRPSCCSLEPDGTPARLRAAARATRATSCTAREPVHRRPGRRASCCGVHDHFHLFALRAMTRCTSRARPTGGYVAAQRGDAALRRWPTAAACDAARPLPARAAAVAGATGRGWRDGRARRRVDRVPSRSPTSASAGLPVRRATSPGHVVPDVPARAAARRRPRALPRRRHARRRRPRAAVGHRPRRRLRRRRDERLRARPRRQRPAELGLPARASTSTAACCC